MPNVGRPSKGCKNCRDRKVKCDQKRPSCSQCVRAGTACHGYRDALSMMFKNESHVVAKKAEKRYEELAKQKASASTRDKALPSDGSARFSFVDEEYVRLERKGASQIVPLMRYPPTPDRIVSEIAPNIEDRARCFFVANYVAQPSVVPRGQFEWVPELLSQPDIDANLLYSVNAVSLAGFANAAKSPKVMRQARSAYVTALQLTNSALRVKETAIKDSTLVSVILLGMFEHMAYIEKSSVMNHIDGACALFTFRGRQQFKSDMARVIFDQFYSIALVAAVETGTPVNAGMHELYEALQPKSNYDIHDRPWSTKMIHVMQDAINLFQDKTSNPVAMVNAATTIDRNMDTLIALMPSIWHYSNIQLETPSDYLYGRIYSVYTDPWIAQMWNHLRSCRLRLYTIIRTNITKGCLEYDPPLFTTSQIRPQREAAERVLRATTTAIIASTPQITGMIPFPKPRSSFSSSTSSSSSSSSSSTSSALEMDASDYMLHPPGTFLDPAKSPGMMYLIWPLYASSTFDFSTSDQRQWAIDMLEFIALKIGSRQAVVLAGKLRDLQRAGKGSVLGLYDATELIPSANKLV